MKKWLFLIILVLSSCAEEICDPKDRYLVVTPFAGTTNRLRVIASAEILAKITDRKLVIDWTLFAGEMPSPWKNLFRNPSTMFEDSNLISEGCSLARIKSAKANDPVIKNLGNLNKASFQQRMGDITEDKEPIVYFGTSLNFRPNTKYISYDDYNAQYRDFYKNLKLPNFDAKKEIEDFKKKYFDGKYPIGVHYRAWNMSKQDHYVKNDPENRYIGKFIEEMKKALAQNQGKDVVFYLSSDDPKVKAKLMAEPALKNKIVTRNNVVERDTNQGQLSALVDWFLLGATNYIIGTYQSSFSDEAAHLTTLNKKISIGESPFGK